ncbi:MAG: hypothetical protein BZY75_03835 [SAR202 cluster bacterium Io17-Chloro-G7]|nr:MAG: hypothetical protein BZY75_03835 [SAR202 cluster bacterium Io17-Chloro-G7]
MAQPNPRLKFTLKDYMSLPGDKWFQLLDGEMILAPSPNSRHQTIAAQLFMVLNHFVRLRNIGRLWFAPLDVILSDHDVAQPDILFVSNERSGIITDANIQGAPDLVVEILSPGTVEYDRGYKRALYGRHGVMEYWIVDPEAETVGVLTLGDQGLSLAATYRRGEMVGSPLLQGISLGVDQVFSE